MSTEAIKYFKKDESLTINVEKREEYLRTSCEPDATDSVERVEAHSLGIAPKHIREYEIKKPEEKEPSLIKMISNKIKGNQHQDVTAAVESGGSGVGSRENLADATKLKEANNSNNETIKGNK